MVTCRQQQVNQRAVRVPHLHHQCTSNWMTDEKMEVATVLTTASMNSSNQAQAGYYQDQEKGIFIRNNGFSAEDNNGTTDNANGPTLAFSKIGSSIPTRVQNPTSYHERFSMPSNGRGQDSSAVIHIQDHAPENNHVVHCRAVNVVNNQRSRPVLIRRVLQNSANICEQNHYREVPSSTSGSSIPEAYLVIGNIDQMNNQPVVVYQKQAQPIATMTIPIKSNMNKVNSQQRSLYRLLSYQPVPSNNVSNLEKVEQGVHDSYSFQGQLAPSIAHMAIPIKSNINKVSSQLRSVYPLVLNQPVLSSNVPNLEKVEQGVHDSYSFQGQSGGTKPFIPKGRMKATRLGDDCRWKLRFEDLKAFKEKHGHCLVPTRSLEYPLGSWVSTQRAEYKRCMYKQKSSSMTTKRISLLESVGFVWNVDVPWNERFKELVQFKERFGHCSVPRDFQINPALGRWVHAQRSAYRNLTKGIKSKITLERVHMLEKIGFCWKGLGVRGIQMC